MTDKVVIAVTSHDQLGDTGRQTGFYLPEVAHPYFELTERGIGVDIVSVLGGAAPMDPNSRDMSDPRCRRFVDDPSLARLLRETRQPNQIDAANYAGIIFAGGHGVMWDFPHATELHALATAIYEKGGVVAAVCHGPAALVNLVLSDGRHLVAGKRFAAFTDDEEAAVGLTEVVPFLLESTLRGLGGMHEKAPNFKEKVVVDGRLVTGQNPASAEGVGKAVAQQLLGARAGVLR